MRTFKDVKDIKEDIKQAVKKPIPVGCCQINEKFEVHTLEGVLSGKKGDWLMIGIEGEMYACDEAIFKKTYSLIGDNKIKTL